MATLAELEQAIGTAIGQQETGNGAAGVGASLNNPGAIKYAPWEVAYGAMQAPTGFAQFPSLTQGRAAMLDLIDRYIKSGNSLQTLISGWAPPSDNNVNNDARVAQLAQVTGLNPALPIAGQTPVAASGSSGSSGAVGGLQGAWDSVWGVNGGKGLSTQVTEDAAGLFPWGRAAAGVAGLILLAVGLVAMNTRAKVVVQEFGKGLVSGAKTAVVA